MAEDSIQFEDVVKGKSFVRAKENSAARRQRRHRADERVFSRIIRACQAAAVHHSQSSRLVRLAREHLCGGAGAAQARDAQPVFAPADGVPGGAPCSASPGPAVSGGGFRVLGGDPFGPLAAALAPLARAAAVMPAAASPAAAGVVTAALTTVLPPIPAALRPFRRPPGVFVPGGSLQCSWCSGPRQWCS